MDALRSASLYRPKSAGNGFMRKPFNRITDIKKSPTDKNSYQGLILYNKLKVLLVNLPKVGDAQVILRVNVGFYNDPKSLPGLAHLCQNTLISGSLKYPNITDFDNFLTKRSGTKSLSTNGDHSIFSFSVEPDSLKAALDRFSSYFVSPLFMESTIRKKIAEINCEYESFVESYCEYYHLWEDNYVDKYFSDTEHPYRKFGIGNKETLETVPKKKKMNIKQELIKFFKNWYSANLMSLCIIGKYDLDEVVKTVLKLFTPIVNTNVVAPSWTNFPFRDEHYRIKLLRNQPLNCKEARELILIFPMPDYSEYYKTTPTEYWQALINSQHQGSINIELQKLEWSTSVTAKDGKPGRGFDFFVVTFHLTAKGLHQVDEIIKMFFQYVNMMKKYGALQQYFEEMRNLNRLYTYNREDIFLDEEMKMWAENLLAFPMEEVLMSESKYTEWNPDLINSVLEYLSPKKVRLHVVADEFEVVLTDTEPILKEKFKRKLIPTETIEQWANSGLNPIFQLPKPNNFITTEFDIKQGVQVEKYPVVIRDNQFLRFWFKQDDEFLEPKGFLSISCVSPLINESPLNYILAYLYKKILMENLQEVMFFAYFCHFVINIYPYEKNCIKISISGFDQKIPFLFNEILEKIFNLAVTKETFSKLKNELGETPFDIEQTNAQDVANFQVKYLLVEKTWSIKDFKEVSKSITLEALEDFRCNFLRKMFIEIFLHGNFTKIEGLKLADQIETRMRIIKNSIAPSKQEKALPSELELPPNSSHYFETKDLVGENSCACAYYQIIPYTTENYVLLLVTDAILSTSAVLDNEEELGFLLKTSVEDKDGILSLSIMAEGPMHPTMLNHWIEDFFPNWLETRLKAMTYKAFVKFPAMVHGDNFNKPSSLLDMSYNLFNEIQTRRYNFKRNSEAIEFLMELKPKDVLDFSREHFRKNKRQLIVLAIPEDGSADWEKEKVKIAASRIQNAKEFRVKLKPN